MDMKVGQSLPLYVPLEKVGYERKNISDEQTEKGSTFEWQRKQTFLRQGVN